MTDGPGDLRTPSGRSRAAVLPEHVGPTPDARSLQIRWRDGHVSVYDPRFLRLHCPCAGCVDEMTGERTLVSAMVPEGVYPAAIHPVGRYALQFVWSDGHDTGFFTYDYLRRLCPCPECRLAALSRDTDLHGC